MERIKENMMMDRLIKFIDIIDKVSIKLEWLLTNILCIFISMNFSTEIFNISQVTINISKTKEISVNTLLYVALNLIIVYFSGKFYKLILKKVEEGSPKTPAQMISSVLATMVAPSIDEDKLNLLLQKIVNRILLIIVTSIIILTMLVNVTI